jgi:hypothetical protein
MLILLAATLASIAAVTGILAIGSGRHWQFEVADYFRGKRNAILYLWVTSSTIFSILHSGVILEYGLTWNWGYRSPDAAKWFALHAVMGVLLTGAHLFVASTLSKEVGPVDKYLWGNRRRASV